MSTSDGSLPRVSVRLRRAQVQLIADGLALAEKAVLVQRRAAPTPGSYDPNLMASIRRLRRELQERLLLNRQSYRLHLHAIELAACALGARLAFAAMRRGELSDLTEWPARTRRRFLTTLEKFRKRAKRSSLRVAKEEYGDQQRRWLNLCLWIRAQHTEAPAVISVSRRYYRRTLDNAVELAKRELRVAGIAMPPERELRSHVSACLRNIRRGHGDAMMKDLLKRHSRASAYVLKFVRRRLECTSTLSPITNPNLKGVFSHEH